MVRRERIFLRRSKRQKFGELLLTNGSITPAQLEDALATQQQEGGMLGDILLQKGYISETEIVRVLSAQYGLPVLRSKDYEVNKEILERFSAEFLYSNILMPFDRIGNLILVLVCDLPCDEAIATIEKESLEVVFYVSSHSDIFAGLMQAMPISDEERRQYLALRRKRMIARHLQNAAVVLPDAVETEDEVEAVVLGAPAGPGSNGGAAEGDLLGGLDSSWETIFDAAEKNLKKGPQGRR